MTLIKLGRPATYQVTTPKKDFLAQACEVYGVEITHKLDQDIYEFEFPDGVIVELDGLVFHTQKFESPESALNFLLALYAQAMKSQSTIDEDIDKAIKEVKEKLNTKSKIKNKKFEGFKALNEVQKKAKAAAERFNKEIEIQEQNQQFIQRTQSKGKAFDWIPTPNTVPITLEFDELGYAKEFWRSFS